MTSRMFLRCPLCNAEVMLAHALRPGDGWATPVGDHPVDSPAARMYAQRLDAFLAAHSRCGGAIVDGLARVMELRYGGGG